MQFRFVDKIVAWTPHQVIRGRKAVSFEEYQLKERFADEARFPESLLLEAFLQLGNWLILLSTDFTRMGMIVRLDRVEFAEYLRPGEVLELEVRIRRQRTDAFELFGQGHSGGRLVIQGGGGLAQSVPAVDYVDPDALRVLFSELYDPAPGGAE